MPFIIGCSSGECGERFIRHGHSSIECYINCDAYTIILSLYVCVCVFWNCFGKMLHHRTTTSTTSLALVQILLRFPGIACLLLSTAVWSFGWLVAFGKLRHTDERSAASDDGKSENTNKWTLCVNARISASHGTVHKLSEMVKQCKFHCHYLIQSCQQ